MPGVLIGAIVFFLIIIAAGAAVPFVIRGWKDIKELDSGH